MSASAPLNGTSDVEYEHGRFPGGAVVQLTAGHPEGPDAVVATVHPAAVTVTDRRVVAVLGEAEWCWQLADIERVAHGQRGPWSIFVVPGVPDHGVAVPPEEVAEFRRSLDAALAGAGWSEAVPDPAWEWAIDPDREQPAGSTDEPVLDQQGPPDAGTDGWTIVDDVPFDEEADSWGPLFAGDGPDQPTRPQPIVGLAPPPDVDRHQGPGTLPRFVAPAAVDDQPRSENGAQVLPPPPPPAAAGRGRLVSEAVDRLRARLGPRPSAPAGGRATTWAPPGRRTTVGLAALEAREVSAWFGAHHVLDRVSLEMAPGEVTALIGPSGCGKSTFLRILNRMHEMIPTASLAGEVLLDGGDIYDIDRRVTDARRQIGMVFQKPNPFPAMSIYDNVVASFRLTGSRVAAQDKDEVVESCLRKAGLWTEVRDRLRQPGGGLSGGQQQRLCIARALAIRPRVLLMDEPCSALDPTSTRRIEQTIRELADEVTIVIVTHNMQQAARVSHRCAFFLAEARTPGVIVEHGPTEAMFNHPQDERTNDYVNGRFG